MPVIVKHKISQRAYLLLGAGISEFKSSRPGVVMGTLNPIEEHGRSSALAVCDEHGRIVWFDSDELYVVAVDGRSPDDALKFGGVQEADAEPLIQSTNKASNAEIDAYLHPSTPPKPANDTSS